MAGAPTESHHVNVLGTPEASDITVIVCAKRLGIRLHFYLQPIEFIKAALESPPDFLIIDLDCFSDAAHLQLELKRGGCRSAIIAIASGLNVEKAIQFMEGGALTLFAKAGSRKPIGRLPSQSNRAVQPRS